MSSSSSSSGSSYVPPTKAELEDALRSSIFIPMINTTKNEGVTIFFDELPVSAQQNAEDLVDLLKSELAPLDVWRRCAVEYHRRGFKKEFEDIMATIVTSITDKHVEMIYRARDDFSEGMAQIYDCLAANQLAQYSRIKDRPHEEIEEKIYSEKIVEFLRRAEDHVKLGEYNFNEYTWLIKGFYELRQGDKKRAEHQFSLLLDKAAKNKKKGKFLFGAYIGCGVIAYAKKKYPAALEYFHKAIVENPGCGASVRVAVASCLFKMGKYESSRSAVEYALELDSTNTDALVLLALLEQVAATKDKAKRLEHRANSSDYCVIAMAVDEFCPMALIHKANHCFHEWRLIALVEGSEGSALCVDDITIQLSGSAAENAKDLAAGDRLMFTTAHPERKVRKGDELIFFIREIVDGEDGDKVVKLQHPVDASMVGNKHNVAAQELFKVSQLANRAISATTISEIKSESYFIQGRVLHVKGSTERAMKYYRNALQEWPEMHLASFGLAQICLSKREFSESLALFENILEKYPDDRDTLAYVLLLRALHKEEATTIEKVREAAIGFQYDIDLWLSQGNLRQRNPTDYPLALRCYQGAMECIKERAIDPSLHSSVLSNIAVLQHSLGRTSLALDFCRQALNVANDIPPEINASTGQPVVNPVFKSSDFEDVFYTWSSSICDCVCESTGHFVIIESDVDISTFLAPGLEVLVGDIIHVVESVESNSFTARSPVRVFMPSELQMADAAPKFQVRKKVPGRNFNDSTITLSFNFARILEDSGRSRSASELYVELLKQHSSFLECYLRLSNISRSMGQNSEAALWISRALAVDEKSGDALANLGDLHIKTGNWEGAKKVFEEMCRKDAKDPRPMLALGNLYFHNITGQDDPHLKDSYKYFHHVLTKDPRNVFSANGLGMVCAEKRENEVAREVFSRARELNMNVSEDICTNLAHVHLIQGRMAEAEHLYQANIKAVTKTGRIEDGLISSLCECMAFAQYSHGRHEDSLKSLLRALHQEPTGCGLRAWYNIAVVRASLATTIKDHQKKTVRNIMDAMNELAKAQKLFSHLASFKTVPGGKGQMFDLKGAAGHEKFCINSQRTFAEHLATAEEEERRRREERRFQEETHLSRQKAKEEERDRALRVAEEAAREKQRQAAERAKKLEEMREKWVAIPAASEKGPKGSRKQKAGGGGASQTGSDDEGAPMEDDGKLNVLKSVLSTHTQNLT